MGMVLKNKKGVAPLIATVLLIAFTVSIGVLVVNWGRDYIETTTSDTSDKVSSDLSCNMDISIEVKEISNTKKICYNGTAKTIELMLENTGREDIAGIRIIAIDSDDGISQHDNLTFSIPAGSVSEKYTYNYSESANLSDEIQMIEIIPLITLKGKSEPQACSSKALNLEEVSECN